jgi:hypothetical protein
MPVKAPPKRRQLTEKKVMRAEEPNLLHPLFDFFCNAPPSRDR